jgi:hypothetical protein
VIDEIIKSVGIVSVVDEPGFGNTLLMLFISKASTLPFTTTIDSFSINLSPLTTSSFLSSFSLSLPLENLVITLADKSGVNLKGKYNVNNFQMNFGLNSSKKENETEEEVDDLFYQQFWILQKYLMNPFLVSLF